MAISNDTMKNELNIRWVFAVRWNLGKYMGMLTAVQDS